jgi:hypothetical protein
MLIRDWCCLNKRCGATFRSDDHGNPNCPACGCARVSWIPGGGHIASQAPAADRQLRSLADQYGMKNINSGSESRLNRAMPKFDHAPADGPVLGFAPGFSAPFNRSGRATCGVSANNVNFKASVAAEARQAPSRTYPQIGRDHWAGIRQKFRA